MLQLRLDLKSTGESPKSGVLSLCQFKEQIEIKFSWAKQFIVNLKALYQLGRMTQSSTKEKKPFKYGWGLVKCVLNKIEAHAGDYKEAAKNDSLVKVAFDFDLLLERI